MKFLVVLTMLSQMAFAGHLETVCEKSLIQDPQRPQATAMNAPIFSEDLIARRGNGGEYVIEDANGNVLTRLMFPVGKIIKTESSIWALAPFDLIEMDLQGQIKDTFNFEASGNQDWKALSMVKKDNVVIISRGWGGLLAFDLTTKSIKWQNSLSGIDDGYPSGLAINGDVLYAAMATSQPNGFTGIATIDMNTGAVVKRAPYHREWGVIDTDAIAHMYKGNLVLNNGGWIHMITPKQLDSEKAFKPRWVAKVMPAQGDVHAHYMRINGDFFFQGSNLLGCGIYTTQENGMFTLKAKLFELEMP